MILLSFGTVGYAKGIAVDVWLALVFSGLFGHQLHPDMSRRPVCALLHLRGVLPRGDPQLDQVARILPTRSQRGELGDHCILLHIWMSTGTGVCPTIKGRRRHLSSRWCCDAVDDATIPYLESDITVCCFTPILIRFTSFNSSAIL